VNPGPAHSATEAVVRIVILLVVISSFFGTLGVGFWLGNKWFGGFGTFNRLAALPLSIGIVLWLLATMLLFQFFW
jgi:hypothetical protein